MIKIFFFFNDTATTEIYTLSLHDALPISGGSSRRWRSPITRWTASRSRGACRSEEHTSELQSQSNLVCRLLLEKKKNGCILQERFRAHTTKHVCSFHQLLLCKWIAATSHR